MLVLSRVFLLLDRTGLQTIVGMGSKRPNHYTGDNHRLCFDISWMGDASVAFNNTNCNTSIVPISLTTLAQQTKPFGLMIKGTGKSSHWSMDPQNV